MTPVDALDTMLLMGSPTKRCHGELIATKLDFDQDS